jgi:membrane protease YdiL (CAAX protease family)
VQPEEPLIPSTPGPRESVTPADWRLIAVGLAAVALSAFYISLNYRAAFPQASLKLELSREAITAKAETFLRGRGHELGAYRNITLFDADDDARLFLEREAGLVEANRLMEREVPVWRWRARWYQPPQREEFRVWLSPDTGRLVGFDHIMAEDAPGKSLDVDAARALAEAFLRERVTWTAKAVEAQSEDKPKRRDHSFTFEREGFSVKEGRVRASVVVRGGRVEGYQEFLKVPEQWQRDFAALRSKNQLYSQIAQAFYIALILGAAITLIAALRRGDLIWRPAVLFSSVVAGLNILAEWNNLPFSLNALPTTTPIGEALLMILLQSAGAGAGVFIYVIFAAAPGLVAYRDLLPSKLNLTAAFSRRALETREFFRAAVAGLGFAGFHLAFVTAFYLIGQRYGVWSPQDVEQSDLLSTFAPWLYPLTMSLMAASSEEFWFRLLAVPLLKRWTGSTWIAILVPAFVWGFLHANYPQQPGYIRGVEVGIIGVAAGALMLRFGILATLIWHYTVDAILFSTYLLAAGSWPLKLSGFVVSGLALFPLAACVWLYRRNGGFVVDASLTNAALERGDAPSHAGHVSEPEPHFEPMVPPRVLYALAVVAAAVALLVNVPAAGDFLRVHLTRDGADAAAGAPASNELRANEFAPNLDTDSFEYLRQQVGRAKANRILEEQTITGVWRVRYFAPSRKDEVWRYVGTNGKVFRQDLVLDEKGPGANLAAAEARKLAETHAASQGVNLARYKLVDSSSEKHDQRTDHSFVWEDETFRVGEARARISVDILGSEPSRFRRFIKLPEQWQRAYHKPRLRALILPAAMGGFAFLLIGVFLRHLRQSPFRPSRYLPLRCWQSS